jgi:hypothetical protein
MQASIMSMIEAPSTYVMAGLVPAIYVFFP